MFCFPVACQSFIYRGQPPSRCIIASCLKNTYILIKKYFIA